MTSSWRPWTIQTGTSFSWQTSTGLPPPLITSIAAKRSGVATAKSQAPNAPMLMPVR